MASAFVRKSSHLRQALVRIQGNSICSSVSSTKFVGSNESKRQPLLLLPAILRHLSTEGSSTEANRFIDEKRRSLNRILYRSRQRGHLELDLILGKWTEENIEKLDDQRIKSLVEILDLENPELWKWLTGQEVLPPHLTENPVFMEIHEKIMGALNMHSPSETRAKLGKPWVRGWDDNRKIGGPQVGNQ